MDTLKLIEDKEKELKPLYDRMDMHARLANMVDYHLTSPFDKKTIKGGVDVTTNKPAVFADAIISYIIMGKWQTLVEGNISPTTQRKVEKFLEDSYIEADYWRQRCGKSDILSVQADRVCLRGWIGCRWLWTQDEESGEWYLDGLPVDMRFVSYDTNKTGYEWVNYRTRRSKYDIEREYGYLVSEARADVCDFWHKDVHEVWVKKAKIFEEENRLKYPPFVIVCTAKGFDLDDEDYIANKGQGILFLNDKLYDKYQQLISIYATLAMKSIDPNYQRELQVRKGASPSPSATGGQVYEVEPGSEYKLMPEPDINMASRVAYDVIGGDLRDGGITDIDLGTALRPMPSSALLITEQAEIRHKLQKASLDTVRDFYSLSSCEIRDQYIFYKINKEIGKAGRHNQYSYTELGDPDDYEISYRLTSKSRKMEIANAAVGSSLILAKALSRDTTYKEIMMLEDPDGEIAKLEAEEAEELDPVIKMAKRGYRLLVAAKDIKDPNEKRFTLWESERLTKTAASIMAQQKRTGFQPEKTSKPQPQQLLPLLGRENLIE